MPLGLLPKDPKSAKSLQYLRARINGFQDRSLESESRTATKKRAGSYESALCCKTAITCSPAFAVPSAWQGLTSLFGMGRGGALALSSPESLSFLGPRAPGPHCRVRIKEQGGSVSARSSRIPRAAPQTMGEPCRAATGKDSPPLRAALYFSQVA